MTRMEELYMVLHKRLDLCLEGVPLLLLGQLKWWSLLPVPRLGFRCLEVKKVKSVAVRTGRRMGKGGRATRFLASGITSPLSSSASTWWTFTLALALAFPFFGCWSRVASVEAAEDSEDESDSSEFSESSEELLSFLGSHGSFTFMMYAAGGKEISIPSPSLQPSVPKHVKNKKFSVNNHGPGAKWRLGSWSMLEQSEDTSSVFVSILAHRIGSLSLLQKTTHSCTDTCARTSCTRVAHIVTTL